MHIRPNDIRDAFAILLNEVCYHVKVGPVFTFCEVKTSQIEAPLLMTMLD